MFSGIDAPIKIRTNHELPLPLLRRHSISSRPWQRGKFVAMTARLISAPLPWHLEQVPSRLHDILGIHSPFPCLHVIVTCLPAISRSPGQKCNTELSAALYHSEYLFPMHRLMVHSLLDREAHCPRTRHLVSLRWRRGTSSSPSTAASPAAGTECRGSHQNQSQANGKPDAARCQFSSQEQKRE